MQDLEGHGEDFELYPKSKGKTLRDFEQRNQVIRDDASLRNQEEKIYNSI